MGTTRTSPPGDASRYVSNEDCTDGVRVRRFGTIRVQPPTFIAVGSKCRNVLINGPLVVSAHTSDVPSGRDMTTTGVPASSNFAAFGDWLSRNSIGIPTDRSEDAFCVNATSDFWNCGFPST